MRISIIIPTYRPESYIYECLNSIKKQSFPRNEFEIIIVLNGCLEPYYSNLSIYVKNELSGYQVRLLHSDIGSVSNARNIGIDVSEGDYITFIDDDDWVSSSFLQKLLEKTDKNTLVVSNFQSFYDNVSNKFVDDYISRAYNNTKQNDVFSRRSFLSSACGKLISREMIQNKRFDIELKNSEDALFMFSISNNIDIIELADEDAIYYRRVRHSSTSHKQTSLIVRLHDCLLFIKKIIYIYIKDINNYSFKLFLSRLFAAMYYHIFKRV